MGDATFAGSIPALYDKCLGPLLFAPYAEHTAGRLAWLREGSLLEVAAGTGIATEALVRRLPPGVAVCATDLEPAMLAHAAAKPDLARVVLRRADALALPFADGSFDAVICEARRDLVRAGFSRIDIDAVSLTCRASSCRDVAIGFCQASPVRGELEAVEEVTERVAMALARRFGPGPIEAPMQALLVDARA